MKPRRVLHITREYDGGLIVVLGQIVRRLNRDRYDPIVAFDSPGQSYIRKKLSESDIKTIDLRLGSGHQYSLPSKTWKTRDIGEWIESHFGKSAREIYLSLKFVLEFLLFDAPRVKLFLRIIKENRIDILHTHSNLHYGKSEIIAALISGVPCITHAHAYPHYTFFDRLFSKFVTSYIYISRDIAEQHIAQGEPRNKGIIIHNGVDIRKFAQPHNVALIRRQFNVHSKEILVGTIGRIDWWKGQDYFIEAMGTAIKVIPDLKGLIIGDIYKDPYGKIHQYMLRLQSLAKSLNINDKIIFTGFRHDVPRVLAALDVVVHASSIPEPFGLVVIEGMAAGKPVVATAAGGVLDIIEDGVNGLLVPCKDSKAMAMAILQIVSSQENAKRMGMAARRRVIEKFTVQHQIMAVQKLYDSILNIPQY